MYRGEPQPNLLHQRFRRLADGLAGRPVERHQQRIAYLIGGGLQLVNDVAFFLMFRHVRPPEEVKDKG